MKSERAMFRCVAGCEGEYPTSQVIYACPSCGELLGVHHDRAPLLSRSADEWKSLFEKRYMTTQWPYGSGVWGKKEWVLPGIRDENIVSMAEGGTNLFWMERYGKTLGLSDLWLKLCGNSHTGSFKDLGMTVLVSAVKQMISDGVPIKAIACASTGDTSAALSAYAAAAGIRAVVLLPKGKVTHAQLAQPLANGAEVLAIDTDFDGCMQSVQKLAKEPGVYLANSMNSLRLEGQKTVAIEICQQFGWEPPDWVVIPGGNLGNVAALGAGFDLMQDLGLIKNAPRICVAQAEQANPLYRAFKAGWQNFAPITAGETEASAIRIGNPISVRRAIRVLEKYDGVVEQASESELRTASLRADRTGTYCCPHTGVALAALSKLVEQKLVLPEHRTVVISTASGLKFTDFKTRSASGIDANGHRVQTEDGLLNQPLRVAHDYPRIRDAVLGQS